MQDYNDAVSYLRDLKSGIKNSNSFYSRFENEDHYKVSSMDIGELKTQVDGISNAQGDMDLVDEINRSLVPFEGYGDNATPEAKRKHEDFINKVTTLWEKYGKDKYDTVEDFYYGEFYTGAGGNVYKAAEEKAKGVAYTTKSGQNITWQSLYDNAVAAEDLANRLNTYSKNSDWDELSKGKDVSSDPDRQSDYDRTKAPQDEPVKMIWYMNAEELIIIANKRLCKQASEETRQIVKMMCDEVLSVCPEFDGLFVPMCQYHGGKCHEMFSCKNKNLS
jgi:hypothetical protein